MNEIEIGAKVRILEHKDYKDSLGFVTAVSSGWYTVELDDERHSDNHEVKLRQADLELWAEESAPATMSGTMGKYRKDYVTTYTAKGNRSQSSATSVTARHMEGYDHAAVAQIAAMLLGSGEDVLEFYHRYAHLNNGQMRMNCGNRINAAVKRGDIVEDDVANVMALVEGGECELTPAGVLDARHRPDRIKK